MRRRTDARRAGPVISVINSLSQLERVPSLNQSLPPSPNTHHQGLTARSRGGVGGWVGDSQPPSTQRAPRSCCMPPWRHHHAAVPSPRLCLRLPRYGLGSSVYCMASSLVYDSTSSSRSHTPLLSNNQTLPPSSVFIINKLDCGGKDERRIVNAGDG
ncbi:hypothetical protein Pmani_013449 [Petrolisthes manimaculis]|uniref:Uncharacterized protein n=1 Tax=Petrolisthes manimaculis TaxID=1843537 RepID=A0AAE1PW11_9EUCA|nr:hypothetical protein Pmani_013449 [Petrolisthes manimaculis]